MCIECGHENVDEVQECYKCKAMRIMKLNSMDSGMSSDGEGIMDQLKALGYSAEEITKAMANTQNQQDINGIIDYMIRKKDSNITFQDPV